MAERPRLTGAQRTALQKLQDGSTFGLRFQTMEALRRRGLVERHTFRVTNAWYADERGVFRQPWWAGLRHDWFLKDAGRRALKDADND